MTCPRKNCGGVVYQEHEEGTGDLLLKCLLCGRILKRVTKEKPAPAKFEKYRKEYKSKWRDH